MLKRFFGLIFLLTLFAQAVFTVEELNGMFQDIQSERKGIDMRGIKSIKEPFIKPKKEQKVNKIKVPIKKEKIHLVLHAILNNKAYINDGWKKIGDKIEGYTLKHIGKRGVVLRKENQIKKLLFYKKRANFIRIKGRK